MKRAHQRIISFLAIIKKELQLLWHDKPSLMILFIMPMSLVLILTLVDTSEPNQSSKIAILLLSQDNGKIAQAFEGELEKIDYLEVKNISKERDFSLNKAKQTIVKGGAQALIIIPKNLSRNIEKNTQKLLLANGQNIIPLDKIQIILDPTIPGGLKNSITTTVQLLIQNLQEQLLADVASHALGKPAPKISNIKLPIMTAYANASKKMGDHAPIEQNVSAWTLFGMFLIIVPLASVLVKEREQGILPRLYVAPVSRLSFLITRIIAFVSINLIQLALMFSIGVFILPIFGLPSMNISHHMLLIALTGIIVAFVATGFGILLGTWAKTYEQATALGPVLIIIAAAVGGIMAPVYLLPSQLRIFTDFSPLYWSQTAFLNILVRDAGFIQLIPELSKLALFALVAMLLSLIKITKRG